MKVYILEIDPNDYDQFPFIHDVYSTKEKAITAIQTLAIENNEPALLLTNEFDIFKSADCYHYPDYESTRYYIMEYEVE